MKELTVNLADRSYKIAIGSGLLYKLPEYFNLNRKILIVTDSGVPKEYAEAVKAQCLDAKIFTFQNGEANKCADTYLAILSAMLDFDMHRRDAVIAVGGGVVGDISGFAASTYMRGIDFYNIPTTLLSQVDSSIGGKTAIDFCGTKNIVGTFYQPKGVIIDTHTLDTLDERQLWSGKSEIVKMAATFNSELFAEIEASGINKENIENIIYESLKIKANVVELDEKESSIRRALNFGHTFGHGIESLGELLHGECVALGMIPFSSPSVRDRLIPVLKSCGLPVAFSGDFDLAFKYMNHDKKGQSGGVDAIFCHQIGTYEIKRITFSEIRKIVTDCFGK